MARRVCQGCKENFAAYFCSPRYMQNYKFYSASGLYYASVCLDCDEQCKCGCGYLVGTTKRTMRAIETDPERNIALHITNSSNRQRWAVMLKNHLPQYSDIVDKYMVLI